MIEDRLWLTTSEGIISQTQTCKNLGPQASWRSTRCQQRPDPTIATTIISKYLEYRYCPAQVQVPVPTNPKAQPRLWGSGALGLCVDLGFVFYHSSHIQSSDFVFRHLVVSVYWILKSYQRSYNTKLRNINWRWSTFNKTSRDAKIQRINKRRLWREENPCSPLWKTSKEDRATSIPSSQLLRSNLIN